MKKIFTDYNDLKKYIGADGMLSEYAEEELGNYLGCIGSNTGSFDLEIDNKQYEIQVKSKQVSENKFDYTYILYDCITENCELCDDLYRCKYN